MTSTIIIPVSGDTAHMANLLRTISRAAEFSLVLSVIVIFDQKKSLTSSENIAMLEKNLTENCHLITGTFNSVGAVRNAGLAHVTTKWYSFCDADDVILFENYLELVSAVDNRGVNLAVSSYQTIRGESEVAHDEAVGTFFDWVKIGRNPGVWRYLFEHQFFSEIRFPEISMGEDQIFLSNVFSLNPKIFLWNKPVYRYSQLSVGSLTSNPQQVRTIIKTLELSQKIQYSTVDEFRKVQLAFMIAQAVTCAKYLPLQTTLRQTPLMISRILSGGISDFRTCASFLFSYLGFKK